MTHSICDRLRSERGGIGIALVVLLGTILAITLLVGLWAIGVYNGLMRQDQEVKSAWSQVESNLQRRYDLIPNLVETVKGYANQEKDVLLGVTQARASVGGAQTPGDKMRANNELSGALSRLMVIVENYPTLKSDVNFRQLADELAGTENRINVARMRYNEQVKSFNQRLVTFPASVIASMAGIKQAEFFVAPVEAKTAPKVKF